MTDRQREQKSSPKLYNNDAEQSAQLADEWWSFDLGADSSFIGHMETSINKTLIANHDRTVLIDKQIFEDIVSTCDLMKIQIEQLSEEVKKHQNNVNQKMSKIEELTTKSTFLESKVKQLEEENQKLNHNYSVKCKEYTDLKTRGINMLKQRDGEITTMQSQRAIECEKLTSLAEQLKTMKYAVKQERAERKKIENEMKVADRIIRNALEEEQAARKQTENQFLIEKTEKMVLEEKVKEMTANAKCVNTTYFKCSNASHNLLKQRVDVLQRQRDILVDSINQRSVPNEKRTLEILNRHSKV